MNKKGKEEEEESANVLNVNGVRFAGTKRKKSERERERVTREVSYEKRKN